MPTPPERLHSSDFLRAYDRRKHDGTEARLLEHAPVVQNQALRGTSSWANSWLGRDHAAQPTSQTTHPTPSGG